MTVDEALLMADAIDPTINGRGLITAVVVLAAEVRRQHAELQGMSNPPDVQWPTIEVK